MNKFTCRKCKAEVDGERFVCKKQSCVRWFRKLFPGRSPIKFKEQFGKSIFHTKRSDAKIASEEEQKRKLGIVLVSDQVKDE